MPFPLPILLPNELARVLQRELVFLGVLLVFGVQTSLQAYFGQGVSFLSVIPSFLSSSRTNRFLAFAILPSHRLPTLSLSFRTTLYDELIRLGDSSNDRNLTPIIIAS